MKMLTSPSCLRSISPSCLRSISPSGFNLYSISHIGHGGQGKAEKCENGDRTE